MSVPQIRIRDCNQAAVNGGGDFVLYWMIAFRRIRWNFALDRALEWAARLKKPVVILEALRCNYPWASDRLHRFILDGMEEKIAACARSNILYHPYVEPSLGAGKGLLASLAAKASIVVTDDYPCFFLPRMIETAASRLPVRLEAVDCNGLLPLASAEKAYPTAFSFRRFLQKELPLHLSQFPNANPLQRVKLPRLRSLPENIRRRWPGAAAEQLRHPAALAALPISHGIAPVSIRGGEAAATRSLRKFLRHKLTRYGELRNHPEAQATSGLSPYLHFGHISAHQIFHELMKQQRWSDRKLAVRVTGSREGWWGVSRPAEEFLDELVTWRELGFNTASRVAVYDRYQSLPAWALATLKKRAHDERPESYTLKHFAAARTCDPLWNAAQRQLLAEGRIHGYLRMLWGKKILQWSPSAQQALEIMIELNNRYALDGRDPNSYSGIFWCLGRYDRPWGPERPIFGKVRYMSSENTARKFSVKKYLQTYAPKTRIDQ
jgi:deoxyribodipyrimidine photo-lyase